MCTIEEKDVLLELLNNVAAKIILKKLNTSEAQKDIQSLQEIREFYYSTNYSLLDYQKEVQKINFYRNKYCL
ncbi:MAG: hypothetical protein IJ078_11205 [Succinivibrionaceae bacterium]|jgi:hypothetical protein|nr:hypothetical protein [Succinivibrionaceae bacterium]